MLVAWSDGDNDALCALTPLVYSELYRLARRYMAVERSHHNRQRYTVSSDGQDFIIDTASDDVETSPITLILNWRSK